MNDDWRDGTLGELWGQHRDKFDPKSSDENLKYIGLEHISQETLELLGHGWSSDTKSGKFRFNKGDILFGKLRPYFRKVVQAPYDGVCSTDIWVIRAKPGTSQRFLYYRVASWEIVNASSRADKGTKMPRADWDFLSQHPIPIPSLPEQQAIAHALGTLDDKTELNRRMNETLEAMARAIFKSWFVDFDPVRAKMEGKEPYGMDEETAALFPDELVYNEELEKEIPEGWDVGKIEDLCQKIENGGTPKRMEKLYWDNGTIPWFKTGELSDGPLIESEEHITEAGLNHSSCKLWEPGTILVALYASPTVGRLGILEKPATSNQACSALLAKQEYGKMFLFHTLLRSRNDFQNIAVGAAQQNISQKIVREHKILIPPRNIIQSFNQVADTLYKQVLNKTNENINISSIRDILLPKLVSGQIRIEDPERFLKNRGLGVET